MPTRIALVSARAALALDEDMEPLAAALRQAGADVMTPFWDDPAVEWQTYSAAVLRSTWDYVERIDEFLSWADRCAQQTTLLNPPDVVRWNTDKHYLLELAQQGIPVVPTRFVEPGSIAAQQIERFLGAGADALTAGKADSFVEFVVKPSIGAGSKDTARYRRHEVEQATQHLARLLAQGRSAMLQPYLSRVEEVGETALIYLGGEFSHAIRKGPLLKAGAALVEGLFAPEQITPRQPQPDELAVARQAYAAIGSSRPVYARIDLIRGADAAPVVLELELTEPSLFFVHGPGSAHRFARAVLERARSAG
jgi:glutathione synthase/RimK-type ligase-like ATP-grasp enzyme